MGHMKTLKIAKTISPILVGMSLVAFSGCSSIGSKSADDLAYSGPTVIDTRTDPSTFELNKNLDPKTENQVIATVKDFNSKVTDVRLRFTRVPITVALKKGEGDEWVGDISKKDLKELAVSGHTMRYDATIVAKNKNGQVATSKSPLTIYVKAPDTTQENS
jgi:hypothetical protein